MAEIKQKLKDLISSLDFIPKKEKEEWFLLITTMDEKGLETAYKHFKDAEKKEEDFMTNLLVQSGQGEELLENIEEITRKFKRESMQKEEKFVTEKEGDPEDILKKLKDL